MYWSKLANEADYDAIAALNYETFVEEIPQHQPHSSRRLVDRFHHENQYVVVYKELELVGMVAFRDVRPFSIDQKVGPVEQYLTAEACRALCEIRLLAVKKGHRNGRVFAHLSKALYRHFYDQGYSACVISGTVREEKLYKQMGFKQFADAVGTEAARFLPMVMTRADSEPFRKRLQEDNRVFYPGPVAVTLQGVSTISHRTASFQRDYDQMISSLQQVSGNAHVLTLMGTGTLANDAMLGQMKSDFPLGRGLMLMNGEFGERLYRQAAGWSLAVDCYEVPWGEPFSLAQVEQYLQTGDYQWLGFVHGETSTGTLNPLEELIALAKAYQVAVCVDCVSSFGALPFSLQDVQYATAVSGKSLGTLGGLAFVFCAQLPKHSSAPAYLNLVLYAEKTIPFTLPHTFVQAVNEALAAYPLRFYELAKRLKALEDSAFGPYRMTTNSYPMIVTFTMPNSAKFIETAALNGFHLHCESDYLRERGWFQISLIQPTFEEDLAKLEKLLLIYERKQKAETLKKLV